MLHFSLRSGGNPARKETTMTFAEWLAAVDAYAADWDDTGMLAELI